MIYINKSQLQQIACVNKELQQVVDFLQKTDLQAIENGRLTILGNEIYANIFEYETMVAEESVFEEHLDYIDIHILLEGKERIDTAESAQLLEIEKDLENDAILYQGKAQASFTMNEDKILVLFPEEAHKVKINLTDNKKTKVRKMVIKVLQK